MHELVLECEFGQMERYWEAEHSDQWDNLIVKCILDGYRKWGVWWEESIKKKKLEKFV